MAGQTRVNKYAEGVATTAPAQTFLQATDLAQYVDDAAYVTAKGSPATDGNMYYNTTSHVIRFYKNGAWQTQQDQASPIITSDTTQSTSKDTGSIITEGGVGIEKNLHVGGNATVDGDLTVSGTTTTINTETLDVEDENITINKGGTQATAASAGLTVEMSDATDVGLKYDSTLTSRWKGGDVGSEEELITAGHTQDMSNKTFTDPVTLDGQASHPATPAAGDYKMYFLDADGLPYYKNPAGDEVPFVTGSAGGGLDTWYIEDFEQTVDASSITTGSSVDFDNGGSASATPTDETTAPISKTKSIKYIQVAGSLNDWGKLPAQSVDRKQRDAWNGMIINARYSGDDGDMAIILYDNTNSSVLTSSVNVFVSSSNEERYEIAFYVPDSCLSVSVGYHVKVENIGAELVFDDIELTSNPFSYKELSVDTEWTSFTPTAANFGALTNEEAHWRRVGDTMEVKGYFTSGTPLAGNGSIGLPSGYEIDSSKVTAGSRNYLGKCVVMDGSDPIFNDINSPILFYDGSDNNNLFISYRAVSDTNIDKITVSSAYNAGESVAFYYSVPILGWTAKSEHVVSATDNYFATKYRNTSGDTLTNNTVEFIDLNNKEIDRHNLVSGAGLGHSTIYTNTWRWIAPRDGIVEAKFSMKIVDTPAWAQGEFQEVGIHVNGTVISRERKDVEAGGFAGHDQSISVHDIFEIKKGEAISFSGYQNSGADRALDGDDFNYGYIRYDDKEAISAMPTAVQSVRYKGNVNEGSTNTRIAHFASSETFKGGGLFSVASDSTNGTIVTVNVLCLITLDLSINDGGSTMSYGICKDLTGSELTSLAVTQIDQNKVLATGDSVSGTASGRTCSVTLVASPGDKFYPRLSFSLVTPTDRNNFFITARQI